MKKDEAFSLSKIIITIGIIILTVSNIILVNEVLKLKKITTLQSSIEARRVSLMVIYQKVLTNTTKEIEELKIRHQTLDRQQQKIINLIKLKENL